MKKSELTQLTQIIECLVHKEVNKEIRKQLPGIIAETFQNMMGNRQQIAERQEPISEPVREEIDEDFKISMREAFAGVTPTGIKGELMAVRAPEPASPKHYTNNPIFNQILNETTPDLRQRERMVGGAAMLGGYSPSVALAAAALPQVSTMGVGEMMNDSEMPSFARMPTMPGPNPRVPMTRPPILVEGQESTHAPMAEIPTNVSALDVARQIPLAAPVAQALTKNYSAMMKLIDNKRKKIA